MPYAIHLRKSRADIEAEMRGEGESLSRHKARLLSFAEYHHLDIVAEYREIISGDKLSERPEMQRLLRDVSAGLYDGVLTVEVSRLTRGDLMDQGLIMNTFKFSGTKIVTPEHTYNLSDDWDEDVIASDMMMARREYKYIKRRMQRGRVASASEGLWQSPAPMGYRKVKIPRSKGWTLEIDEETAPYVRMIFEAYANERIGGAKIAERLNNMGSRTPKGNPWNANSVRQIAANPVYIGKVRWNDRVSVTRMNGGSLTVKREKNPTPILVDGKHPALVEESIWNEAQSARRSHDLTRKHTSAPVRNPLAGLVFCSCCGKSMVRKDNGNSLGSKYDMIRCTTPKCPTTAIALSIVEESVLAFLEQWVVFAEQNIPMPKAANKESPLVAARANLARLKTQLERIYAAYEDGTYDPAVFARRRSDKQKEIDAVSETIAELEQTTVPSDDEIIRIQLPQIRTVIEAYPHTADVQEKNRLLKTVIDRIDYTKTKHCHRNENPAESLTINVYPRHPSDE